ncbi:hypothetical protein Ancab_022989 [Ancistrocladus abbreviatus]
MAYHHRITVQLSGLFALLALTVESSFTSFTSIDVGQGTKWRADVCHAYEILKKGRLKDENIIDYTGVQVNEKNILAASLEDKNGTTWGSKKVVSNTQDDYTLFYTSDHVYPGSFLMGSSAA